MIDIIGNKDCTIYYKCGCGVTGRCMIKPLEKAGTAFVNVSCPLCYATERVKFVQYEEEKEDSLDKRVSWALVLYNEIIDYEVKENLDD